MDELVKQWSVMQVQLATKVIHMDRYSLREIEYIAGLDTSFDTLNPDRACATLVVFRYPSYGTLDKNTKPVFIAHRPIRGFPIPYISGYLGVREVPIYRELIDLFRGKVGSSAKTVYMVDGCGILHPRGLGSASHLGVEGDIPTIGVSKTLMCIDGLDETTIKEAASKLLLGDTTELRGSSGVLHGSAMNTSMKPIYVSVGHCVSLDTAIQIIRVVSNYRIPEPIRQADILSREQLRMATAV